MKEEGRKEEKTVYIRKEEGRKGGILYRVEEHIGTDGQIVEGQMDKL